MPDGRYEPMPSLAPSTGAATPRPRFAEILLEPMPSPFWQMLAQVGIRDAVGVLPRRFADWREAQSDLPWDLVPLAVYQEMVQAHGLELAVIEDNPPLDRIRMGRAGRDEELEQMCILIRSMGRLGIPVLCYSWMPVLGWIRTGLARSGRGGATVASFDLEMLRGASAPAEGTVGEEELWGNLRWFLDRVLPVAEEAGVRLAMHPDDPPLSPVRQMGRIMTSLHAFERLLELNPSPANGITLCQGNFTLMTDDLPQAIREFGASGKVFFAHFRDVRGTRDAFVETFHDDGQTDMFACMQAWVDSGFGGVMRTDHTPTLEGDRCDVPGYSTLGRLHAIGYMTGLRDGATGCASAAAPTSTRATT